ncbi:MAG: ATP-binding cassette domain-containing protein, partial [Akkermansiaceae bacterium]
MSDEKQPNVKAPQVLRLQGLSKAYEKVVALDGVSLAIGAGEFVALRGPSGAGKSTLLYLVAGLLTPDEGAIEVSGEEISKLSGSEKTRFRKEVIGLVFQDARLIP